MQFVKISKRLLLFTSIFCLCNIFVFSQSTTERSYFIKGTLVDSISGEVIPYATVSISSISKSNIFQKRVVADINGNFILVLNEATNYLIGFESIGMKKMTKKILVGTDQIQQDLGKIKMSAISIKLSGVNVSASRPLVKVDLGKISYDVKSDPESQSAMMLDMLRKVPMVTVDGDDKIKLKGTSDFKIYINGKPSGMLSNNPSFVLKGIPASSIKSIEVITVPGVKYDAEGIGGIINIITDHSTSGVTGTIRGTVKSNNGRNGGLYLSTKKGKFGLTTNLNYNYGHDPNQIWSSEKENVDAKSTKYISQTANSDVKYRSYYGNLETSYEFDSLNLVTFSLGGNVGSNSSLINGSTHALGFDKDTLSAFKQFKKSQEDWGGIDMSLDYQHLFKKPDRVLTISYRLSLNPDNIKTFSDLTGLLNYTSYNQQIQYNAIGDEHTFQLDYTEPFSKIHFMDIGVKYIIRSNESKNNYWLQNISTQTWDLVSNSIKNNLDQTQNILGAYGNYTLKMSKLSFRAGLRCEYSWSNVVSNTSFNVHFFNIVPSVNVSYKFNESSSTQISYNQRISRPGILYLNPFVDNSNPYSIYQGNPDLNPQIANSFSLNYNYTVSKLNLNTNLYTTLITNSIEGVSKSLNDSVIYNTYKNIGLRKEFGMAVYCGWQPDKSIRLNFNGNVGNISMSTKDGGENNKGTVFSASLDGQLTLPAELKLNLNGGYYSPQVNLQGRNSKFCYYSISLSRSFIDRKLNVSISGQNLFNERRTDTSYKQTTNYRIDYLSSYEIRSIRLSVSYKFGKLKDQIKKIERSITNDDVKGGGSKGGG